MKLLRPIALLAILLSFLCVPIHAAHADGKAPLRLAYVNWKTEVASANLIKAVVETRYDRPCVLTEMSPREMWASVAEGRQDVLVGAWLPRTQADYYREFGTKVDDLGANLAGAQLGLVVPDVNVGRLPNETGQRNAPYIPVTSIPELKDYAKRFNGRIIGIDPGAGVMHRTREALKVYGLDNMRLVEGDEDAMLEELSRAIQRQEWIVVTGWTPHWMFGVWKLRMLEDPKGVFGTAESIHTIARKGLERDMPDVYEFLDHFHWTPKEMGLLMTWIELDDGLDPYGKALRWVETHPAQVNSWIGRRP